MKTITKAFITEFENRCKTEIPRFEKRLDLIHDVHFEEHVPYYEADFTGLFERMDDILNEMYDDYVVTDGEDTIEIDDDYFYSDQLLENDMIFN